LRGRKYRHLGLVVVTPLGFDSRNGFHDTANARHVHRFEGAASREVDVRFPGLNLVGAFL